MKNWKLVVTLVAGSLAVGGIIALSSIPDTPKAICSVVFGGTWGYACVKVWDNWA